jgi:hypothetical protein
MHPWIASLCSLGLAVGSAFLDVSASGTGVQPAAGTTGSPAWTTLAESPPDCRRGGSDGAPLQRPPPAQIVMGVDGDLAVLTGMASGLRQMHPARIS